MTRGEVDSNDHSDFLQYYWLNLKKVKKNKHIFYIIKPRYLT